ncbi:MAG TPA: cytochrome c oxidase subunit II [Gemmatimonadales bacterium]|nr:cytochrome c oxidase subunit II [Gemmatimonadales bacterium]
MAARHSALASLVLLACRQNGQSALHPGGPAAERIADLWWIMLVVASVVFLLVFVVLVRAFTHKGFRAAPRTASDDRTPTMWVLAGGVALPAVVLTPLFVFSLSTFAGLTPRDDTGALDLVVIGKQWWWDVQYHGEKPQDRLRTANEIRIPVGRPIRIQLRSPDVIHSFWVPGLQGKVDLVPGKVNTIWIQADSVGIYRGECAEYCGLQHARMQFRVIAQRPEEFARWVEENRRPAATVSDSAAMAGQAVFLSSGCAFCHTVRGTPARGVVGPDLTHLASRQTLAAGTLPNTRGHLAGWVGNPQAIKPGNKMPRIPLRPEELHALLAYLGTLR